ncbi:hypothetical protein BH09BAC2_BH09BAC2_04520 [soil metagenome]
MATLKFKIDNEALIEEFFHETKIIGIIAPVSDYKFCWYLNRMLGFNFRINTSLEIQLIKKDRKYFFSIYESFTNGNTLIHYLYNNQHEGEYLLPEFKHLDFLWLIKGDVIQHQELTGLLHSIKTIPSVQLAVEMTDERIKNKQHLIF